MNKNERICDNPANVVALLRRLPSAFPEALVALMKWRGCTVEGLAEAARTSRRSIQRLRHSQTKRSTMEKVIPLCVGLWLPLALSLALIEMGTTGFTEERHLAYLDLLPEAYKQTWTLDKFNEALDARGIAPLGGEE